MEREDIVAAVVDAAGGKLIGRVRLQKVVYLMDQLGLNSGFSYEYHHYGPYSRDLDLATADADALSIVKETFHHRESDGGRYLMNPLIFDSETTLALAFMTLNEPRCSCHFLPELNVQQAARRPPGGKA